MHSISDYTHDYVCSLIVSIIVCTQNFMHKRICALPCNGILTQGAVCAGDWQVVSRSEHHQGC